MNKLLNIFLLSFILFSTNINSGGTNSKQLDFASKELSRVSSDTFSQKLKSKLYSGWNITTSSVSFAKEKVANSFEWVAKNIDVILTKKGVVKTLMILGPLFAAYCYFFSPEPVEYLINKIMAGVAKGGTKLGTFFLRSVKENKEEFKALKEEFKDVYKEYKIEEAEIDATIKMNQNAMEKQAFWKFCWDNPSFALMYGFTSAVEKGTKIGLPFLMGLGTKKVLKI